MLGIFRRLGPQVPRSAGPGACRREGRIDEPLKRLLRVHPEPYEYINEETVHAVLTSDRPGYVGFLDERVADIGAGRAAVELPPKAIFAEGPDQGDFRLMPCVVRRTGKAVKTVKLVGTNTTQREVPDQITVGRAFRLHPSENYVTHVFEACLLSSARTGACAAIAAMRLAPRRERVTIVGAGRVGFYAALYLATLEGVEEILILDAWPDRARAMAGHLTGELRCAVDGGGAATQLVDTDVLVLATTSRRPICAVGDVKAALIVSVGADTFGQRELDGSWAGAGEVYVDTLDSVRVGDLRAWLDDGQIDAGGLVELIRLSDGAGVREDGRVRIFISTGSALLDNLTIDYIVSAQDRLRGRR